MSINWKIKEYADDEEWEEKKTYNNNNRNNKRVRKNTHMSGSEQGRITAGE